MSNKQRNVDISVYLEPIKQFRSVSSKMWGSFNWKQLIVTAIEKLLKKIPVCKPNTTGIIMGAIYFTPCVPCCSVNEVEDPT